MDDARLSVWLDTIWQDLHEAAARRRGDLPNATIASVNEDGAPSLRVVVLRAVDRAAAELSFHTDVRSEKVLQLLARPASEVLFWRPADGLQLRFFGQADLFLPGTLKATAAYEAIPEKGRRKYRTAPAPGTPLPAPDALDFAEAAPGAADPGLARFTLITFRVSRIDALRLDGSDQTRAFFHLDGDRLRSATWIAP
ncbi:pyridoxamine 5'-phosphate oxidase family protein [Aureimonas pseudogalii]|uniref:Pyridoxamine 5'-phosphate oxidase Alr4036 family FMN-binding domain-containing protein n=1 Tax=Aureimonas pseudogalii TaxID=1744844 RepID=A0A7W6ECF7_9HYPH|nr:pyridoxamine 5'-phosphate oxidase family protein [Aureimonas pseudogalii]MBB3998304.1 hypothetical protein [Aureimonas pseudogalii]